ncbi:LuxR C-terminal-related transcriptional regulator [Streptomyces sp. NPDC057638]|uniref:LuxR C-terminal-related transcriptional regulator n=1 Tax=Streptomyces sp. NPDC057638 TaxID=3346190 RepID=UPI0036D0E935
MATSPPPSAAAPLTPLTASEAGVLAKIAAGFTAKEAAAELGIRPVTVHAHMRTAGDKLYAQSAPTRVHAAYTTGQLPLPEPLDEPAALTDEDRRLIEALAVHPLMPQVARAAGLAPSTISGRIKTLMEKCGAKTHPHLVHLGHAFRILHADTAAAGPAGPGHSR